MKIKYSPVKWNEHARIEAEPNTQINYIDENTIKIDEELYEFDNESITFPEIHSQTNGVILEANRNEFNELFITIRRFYTADCTEWDNGEYNEING